MIVKSTTFKLLLHIADFLRGWNKLAYRKDMSMLLDKKVTNYRNCGKCHQQYSRGNLLNKSYSTNKKKKISIPLSKIKPKHLRWHLIFFKKNKRLSITKKWCWYVMVFRTQPRAPISSKYQFFALLINLYPRITITSYPVQYSGCMILFFFTR